MFHIFLMVVFAAIWLAVVGTTIANFMRPPADRVHISLIARAGLLIWSSGLLVAMFAAERHWAPSQVNELNAIGMKCKMTGMVLLVVGLVRQELSHRAGRLPRNRDQAQP